MALIDSLEKEGNWLFKRRGQIPAALFLAAIPVVYFTDYWWLTPGIDFALTSICLVIAFTGSLVRAYTIGTTPGGTSGRNRDEQVAESLNTAGIYSMVRHPLYVGNFLIWIAIVMYTYNIYFVLLVTAAYWLYYERIMFAEERFLEKKFGDQYLAWSRTVPAFVPSLKRVTGPAVRFSLKSVLRREYSGFMATVTGFFFVHWLKSFFLSGDWQPGLKSLYVLGAALMITLVLRTLKHSTSLLSEEGRS